MPTMRVHDLEHYYEEHGKGPGLVFVHGAFVDSRMWEPQVAYFSSKYRVICYDIRGHGRTGPSDLNAYSIAAFADDLASLVHALDLETPAVCGLSLGGMIAQCYAVREARNLRALILADTAVSVSLTLADKLQRYVLFPKWAMLLTLRLMSVESFTRFSFWLARVTRSEQWIGRDESTRSYIEACMLQMEENEYRKIYEAIYDFRLLPLERITCPTLVLNGEHESKSVYRHTDEVLRRVPGAEAKVVSDAGHTSNMENPEAFNALVEEFLMSSA